jgi:hypothetical protein
MVVIVTPAPNPAVPQEFTQHLLLPAIHGGDPRRPSAEPTSKIAPGDFLL